MNRLLLVLIAVVGAAAGCASGGHPAASCKLSAADSVYLGGGMAYRECEVDQKAKLLTTGLHPSFNPPATNTCYSAEVEFVVNQEGSPEMETARVVQRTDDAFANALVDLVRRFRYEPAHLHSIAVRQIVTYRDAVQVVRVTSRTPGPPPLPPRAPRPAC